MKKITISGVTEEIIERGDYPPDKLKKILKDEVIAILGYGPQGRGQGPRRSVPRGPPRGAGAVSD